MQLAFPNGIRASVGVLLAMCVLAMCPPMPAQEPQIDALAEQMAAALSHAKVKSVAVFDFVGPDQTDALGQKLAADFRAALAKAAHGFQVEDHSHLLNILKRQQLAPGSIRDADTATWFLRQAGVDAAILGTLSSENGVLKMEVQAYRVKKSKGISKFETSMPLADNLKALAGKTESDEFSSLPMSGKNGYSASECVICPTAQFSAEATDRKFQGTVNLEATIDETGHPEDIRVKKALPFGLTEQAIKAVQAWRFRPATGPDGKPAVVRQRIQVAFHLY